MNKEILLIICLILGMIGTILPLLPGIPLMFIAILIYSFFDKWVHFSPLFVATIGIITFFTLFIDYFAAFWGVKKFGASKTGIWMGIFGSIFGLLFLGPLGLFLGFLLGVLIGELLNGKSFHQGLKTSLGTVFGFLGSTLLQLSFALIILFLVFLKLY
ncbi:MAG: DUF456 domain-containing protein [Peptococcales bacterium]|jgi:uncharacterized protein YqgC (DUF456 family)